MRGRKPKPTHLKLMQGNPGKRKLNSTEPQPLVDIPSCPPHLADEAKVEWGRVCEELHRIGLLTLVDRAALAGYCQAWARWVEAEEQLKRGLLVRAKNGTPMQNHYLPIANKALAQILSFAAEFGMTPSARSRVHAMKTADDSEHIFTRKGKA